MSRKDVFILTFHQALIHLGYRYKIRSQLTRTANESTGLYSLLPYSANTLASDAR